MHQNQNGISSQNASQSSANKIYVESGPQVSDWTHFNESDLALHVYESIELDIAFFNPNSEGDKKKRPFDYPIHLEVRKAWLENGRFSSGPNTPNETLYIVIMRVCEVCSDIPSVFLDKTLDHISDL